MRVWVDTTTAADVVFFAPIVQRLESSGHTVTVTARRFASADLVLRRYGLAAVLVGHHRGGGVAARAVGLANRTRQLLGSAAGGSFDVAAGSHTSDFVLAGWTLGIPQMTFLDEDDLRKTPFNLRMADEVAVPDAIAREALSALRPSPRRFVRYPGFKEEYYLHDIQPDPQVLRGLGVDDRHVVGVVRPSRASSTATDAVPWSGETALTDFVREVAGRRNVTLVLLARDRDQRQRFLSLGASGLVAPEGMVDGVGLIAAADFVLGDGGIMTREAAALGTPAYTVAGHPLTAVDRSLLKTGRLRLSTGPDDLRLRKKDFRTATRDPRDPWIFVDELLALARRRPRRRRSD